MADRPANVPPATAASALLAAAPANAALVTAAPVTAAVVARIVVVGAEFAAAAQRVADRWEAMTD